MLRKLLQGAFAEQGAGREPRKGNPGRHPRRNGQGGHPLGRADDGAGDGAGGAGKGGAAAPSDLILLRAMDFQRREVGIEMAISRAEGSCGSSWMKAKNRRKTRLLCRTEVLVAGRASQGSRPMADRGPVRDSSTRPYLSDRLDTLLASLDPKVQRLKHAEIAKRYGKAKSWSWASWLTRRINEIQMVLWDQYPNRELPDDDAGHDDLRIVLHHLGKRRTNPEGKMRQWIAEHTPWLDEDEGEALIRYYLASKKKLPKADTLARFMGLKYADRKRIGRAHGKAIRTIGAIDATKAERKAMRKAEQRLADKARQEANRRAVGAKPHAESASRTKPWVTEGVSRRTWYRRQSAQMARGTDSSNIIRRSRIRRDEVVPPSKPLLPVMPITLSQALIALCKRQGRKGADQGGASLSIRISPQGPSELDSAAMSGPRMMITLPAYFMAALDATRRLAAATTHYVTTDQCQRRAAP